LKIQNFRPRLDTRAEVHASSFPSSSEYSVSLPLKGRYIALLPLIMSTAEKAQEHLKVLADSQADSTDSEIRYLAYGARLRTALRAGSRYIAYTSDVGEAFRPVVSPHIVTAAYGISWIYLAGDVSYEAYKARRRGPSPLEAAHFSEPTRVGMVAAKRAAFQSIASMSVPSILISFPTPNIVTAQAD